MIGFDLKSQKEINYTNLSSAILPIPYGSSISIPSSPLRNIIRDLETERPGGNENDSTDDTLDPGSDEPKRISRSELIDLVRDLYLPKEFAYCYKFAVPA